MVIRDERARRHVAWAMVIVATAGIAAIDVLQPAGAIIAVAYVAVVALAFTHLTTRQALLVAAAGSLATVGVGYFERFHDSWNGETVERILAIAAIWLSALLMFLRQRLHAALDFSEARYQAMFDSAADGILMVDASGTIHSVNPAAARMLGYAQAQLKGAPIGRVIPDRYSGQDVARLAAYESGRLSVAHLVGATHEIEAVRSDGTVIPLEINISVTRSGDSEFFSTVLRDITERRQAESRIRENQRTLSTLMSNLPGIAYRSRFDDSMTILFVSQGVFPLTGYEAYEIEGNRTVSFDSMIYHADREVVRATVEAAIAANEPYSQSYRIVHRSGEVRWVLDKGFAVHGHNGDVVCLEGFISDISREKRAETALRESESRFRMIADSTPFMIFASGLDRQNTFVNSRLMEYTGLSLDELLGDGWLTVVHADDVERITGAYKEAFEARRPFEFEYRMRRADGEYCWVVVAGRPRFDSGGDFMGFIGSGMDIHDRKNAEMALHESESRFRNLADSSPMMIWLTGPDGMGTFANKTWLEFTGRSHEAEMDMGWAESVHPDDLDRVTAALIKAHETRTPYDEEYRLRRYDGVYRWVIDRGLPYGTEAGGFAGMCGSCFDFTDHREALEALQESESRFHGMADDSPVMIWMTDIAGTTIFANVRLHEFLGSGPESDINARWRAAVHPDDLGDALQICVAATTASQPLQLEYRMRRADGEWRWILASGSPRKSETNEVTGYIGTCYDITERKVAEVALRESEARFRNVADLTPAVIWVADPYANCLFINQKWMNLTGQTLDTAVGIGWTKAIHPEDVVLTKLNTEAAFTARVPFENEFRVRNGPDAAWRTLLNAGIPRFNADGEYVGFIGSAVDVTDRHRTETIISQITAGVSSSTGDDFFRSLATHLAEALTADMVCVAEVCPDNPSRMKSIAFVQDGEVVADIEYELASTPCVITLREGSYACADDAQSLFTRDQFLQDFGIRGYIGHALRDSNGVNHGVIWVLYRRAVPEMNLATSLLRIFAVRATAELERRQAIEALRLSEEQFRLSLKAGNFTVSRQDRDLRYTWIHNPVNHTEAEIIGRTDFEIFARREALAATELKREVVRSAVGGRAEVELSDGKALRIYDMIVEPELDKSGHVTGVTSISSDITGRKRMEVALRDSEQRYRRLFEHAPIALCEYDLSGVKCALDALESRGVHDVVDYMHNHPDNASAMLQSIPAMSMNRQALALLGVTSSEELLAAAPAILTEQSSASFMKFISALRTGCTSFEAEIELHTLAGVPRQIIARSMLAPGHETTWSRVITSMVDVTSQRRAEAALRLSESRYRQMFEQSPMAKLEVDLSEVKDEISKCPMTPGALIADVFEADPDLVTRCLSRIRIGTVNSTALRVFHAANVAELRAKLAMLFTDATRAAFRELLIRLWNGATTHEVESEFRTLDGDVRVGRSHCALTTESKDDWSQVLVAVVDFTESRQAVDELGRAKRLETAGRLAGQIAHDFNNLLGPLVAYPEILQSKIPAEGRAHEMLRDMQDAALQIAEINQELLTLSRRGHYNTEPLDIGALVRSALRTADIPSAVVVDLIAGPGELLIRGGGAQLMRVLLNLIRNAVEAMDDVGTLSISMDNLYLDEPLRQYATVQRGEYVRVAITDTGCGIPESMLDHIFEPFFTTKKTDKKRGSGLGLPVVHSVVEDHAGYIDVSSAPGQGTTFTLYFPLYRGELAANKPAATIETGHGESVLVVDDDPMQRRIAQTALESIGYNVIVMESGESAVRYLQDRSVDLVILDMVMGGIDGAETLRQIRELYPEQRAMILTGYSTSDRAQAALVMGNCELLAKPIQVSTLTGAIHRVLKLRIPAE